eukprot:g8327.t1
MPKRSKTPRGEKKKNTRRGRKPSSGQKANKGRPAQHNFPLAPGNTPIQNKAASNDYPPVPDTCFVTGGTGLCGIRLVEMLVERGAKRVVSFDIVPPPEHERRLKEKEREKYKTDFRKQYSFKLNQNRSSKKEVQQKKKNLEKRERDQIKIEIQHQKERRQCMKRAHKVEQDTLEKEYQRLLRLLQTKEYSITRARVNNRSLKDADLQ